MPRSLTSRVWTTIRNCVVLSAIAGLLLVHRVAFWLDRWLYPSLKRQPVRGPVFVLGLPRSGTTICHRLIASGQDTFTAMPLWELIFAPALCQKHTLSLLHRLDGWVGHPFMRMLHWIQRLVTGSSTGKHPTSLFDPEEDHLGLLAFGGCFLKVLAFPNNPQVWKLGYFDRDLSEKERRRILDFYFGLLQRHLRFRGLDRIVVSKNPGFTSWIESLAHRFPESRFVVLRRDPVRVVASQLSSLEEGMKFFGNDAYDETNIGKFVELLAWYWQITGRLDAILTPGRYQMVEYDDLVKSPGLSIRDVLDFFAINPGESDQQRLEELVEQAKNYRSSHRYSLDRTGLTEAEIHRVFESSPSSGHNDGSEQSSDKATGVV